MFTKSLKIKKILNLLIKNSLLTKSEFFGIENPYTDCLSVSVYEKENFSIIMEKFYENEDKILVNVFIGNINISYYE